VNLDEREPSPEHQPYEDLDDDLDGGGDWTRDRSPTPVHGDDGGAGSSSKPRKRLLKKGGGGGMPGDDGLDDFGLEDEDADPSAEARKRKGSSSLRDLARGGAGREKKAKKMRMEDDGRGRDTGMVRDRRGSGGRDSGGRDDQDDGEREIQELWDTIAGGESEVILTVCNCAICLIQLLFNSS
jgi:transcription factor SPN1